jgi:hypothetical protein
VKQIDSREGAKRQHRAVALFAVLQCWIRDLDGIVFDRPDLERLLGLERFRGGRVALIKADFKEFFPFQEVYYTKKQSSFGSLYLSRRELKGAVPPGWMSDRDRIAQIPNNEPRLAMFQMWPRATALRDKAEWENGEGFEAAIPFFADFVNCDERFLASYLALLSQGQISPRSLPWLVDASSVT